MSTASKWLAPSPSLPQVDLFPSYFSLSPLTTAEGYPLGIVLTDIVTLFIDPAGDLLYPATLQALTPVLWLLSHC